MGWFKRRAEFLFLLLVALGAGPAGAAIWQWSTTPASNASADPTINWAEGMSPSSVNDSARAMMAAIAGWRDDTSGKLVTTGTANSYLLSTNEGLNATPNDGQKVTFVPHLTNAANVLLTVDGGGTWPIQSSYGVNVPSGALVSGTPYSVTFRGGNAWVLHSFFESPFGVPLGGLLPSTASTPPNSSFIIPAGQCISTSTYANYWSQQGNPASGACPGGQFQVIDLRGRVAVLMDQPPGFSAALRLTGSAFGCNGSMSSVGATCANGVEGSNISLAQLPTGITSNVSVVSPSSNFLTAPTTGFGVTTFSGTGGGPQLWQAFSGGASIVTVSSITSGGTAVSTNTSGITRPQVQPTISVNYFLRVL